MRPSKEEKESNFPFVTLKEFDKNCCSNCNKIYDEGMGVQKQNRVQWYNPIECQSKEIGIVQAVILVFEGLLYLNEKRIPPLEDISFCFDCLYNISELYTNYRQFLEKTHSNSYFGKVFQKSMLRPQTKKSCKNLTSQEIEPFENHPPIQPVNVICSIKEEMTEGYFEDECTLLYDDEDHMDDQTSDCQNVEFPKRRKYEPPKILKVENNWCMTQVAHVQLKKYVVGDRMTLDIGKNRELYGKKITLENGDEISVPYPKQNRKLEKQCAYCVEVFADRKIYRDHLLQEHGKKNVKRPASCFECGKILSTKAKLRAHLQSVHSTEKPFECSTCGKKFPLKERLQSHIRLYHENDIEFRREIEKRKRRAMPRKPRKHVPWKKLHPDRVNEVTCEICSKVFATKQSKADHILVIHKNQKDFACKFCDKKFLKEIYCSMHEKVHFGLQEKKKFKCKTCGQECSSNKSLKNHRLTKHSDNSQLLICEHCGKGFGLQIHLKRHKISMHEIGARKFTCDLCGKKFKLKEQLGAHVKSHSIESSILCSLCPQTFKNTKNLDRHMVAQHCVGSVINCDICQRGFAKISEYEEHMRRGYHIKPTWLRQPAKKRNYNTPCYTKARMAKKLERQKIKREKALATFIGDPKEIEEEQILPIEGQCQPEFTVEENIDYKQVDPGHIVQFPSLELHNQYYYHHSLS